MPSLLRPKGYRMIKDFSVENFRCFRSLELKDLKRVNVVVGQNASGKSALGEAIYLAAWSSPNVAQRIRLERGRLVPQAPAVIYWNKKLFEEYWDDLFYNFDSRERIRFTIHDQPSDEVSATYLVDAFYDRHRGTTSMGNLLSLEPVTPFVFERTVGGMLRRNAATVVDNKLSFSGDNLALPSVATITPLSAFDQASAAEAFSDLVKSDQRDVIQKSLATVFDGIEGLDLALDATLAALFAKVPKVQQHMPIGLASSGMAKLVHILLNITKSLNGVVMIDELENGIYYRLLPQVWKCIYDFAGPRNVQLFVSTHSWECLKAAQSTLGGNEHDFTLLQARKSPEGGCEVKRFEGLNLAAALEQNLEIR